MTKNKAPDVKTKLTVGDTVKLVVERNQSVSAGGVFIVDHVGLTFPTAVMVGSVDRPGWCYGWSLASDFELVKRVVAP